MNGPCIQADINAAINLALRAVASPAAHDVNPRIRTLRGPEKALRARRGNQIEKLRWEKEYPIELQGRQTDDSGNEDRTPNFFFDPFHVADFGCANIHGLPIASSKGLWSSVKNKAWTVLNRLNNDRLEKWGFGRPLPEKDIPY